mgnify:CR=1 FL=1
MINPRFLIVLLMCHCKKFLQIRVQKISLKMKPAEMATATKIRKIRPDRSLATLKSSQIICKDHPNLDKRK